MAGHFGDVWSRFLAVFAIIDVVVPITERVIRDEVRLATRAKVMFSCAMQATRLDGQAGAGVLAQRVVQADGWLWRDLLFTNGIAGLSLES